MNGIMAGECKVFYSRLASLLSIKGGIEKSQVTTCIRAKINFAVLWSIVLCLCGFRIATTRNKEHIDIELESISQWWKKKL